MNLEIFLPDLTKIIIGMIAGLSFVICYKKITKQTKNYNEVIEN